MYDLERFVLAQSEDYEIALGELKEGHKRSHWMWYIFPQLKELGFSYRSKFYGLEGVEEALAYLDHRILGPRYLACVDALLGHKGTAPEVILGGVDAKKLRSSLTLMEAAGGGPSVQAALEAFFGGRRCAETLCRLGP